MARQKNQSQSEIFIHFKNFINHYSHQNSARAANSKPLDLRLIYQLDIHTFYTVLRHPTRTNHRHSEPSLAHSSTHSQRCLPAQYFIMAPPKTRKRKSDQNISGTTTSEDKRKLPVRAKDGESENVKPSGESQGTKVVFGDDDDETVAPAPVAASKPAAPVKEEEESDEDSDDEAPEAVSTSKVASDIKKSKQAAQKAAQE